VVNRLRRDRAQQDEHKANNSKAKRGADNRATNNETR